MMIIIMMMIMFMKVSPELGLGAALGLGLYDLPPQLGQLVLEYVQMDGGILVLRNPRHLRLNLLDLPQHVGHGEPLVEVNNQAIFAWTF